VKGNYRLSIKDTTVSGEGGLSGAGILHSSNADVLTFWFKETSDFSKFMVCPHRQEGRSLSHENIFRTRGSLRFCVDIFYGWPLTGSSFSHSNKRFIKSHPFTCTMNTVILTGIASRHKIIVQFLDNHRFNEK